MLCCALLRPWALAKYKSAVRVMFILFWEKCQSQKRSSRDGVKRRKRTCPHEGISEWKSLVHETCQIQIWCADNKGAFGRSEKLWLNMYNLKVACCYCYRTDKKPSSCLQVIQTKLKSLPQIATWKKSRKEPYCILRNSPLWGVQLHSCTIEC